MIVCICHRVSDRDIERAVRNGVASFEELQEETRAATGCGCCLDCARSVFDAACEREARTLPAGAFALVPA
jgi:bacterioferritin-associated ferredoxin